MKESSRKEGVLAPKHSGGAKTPSLNFSGEVKPQRRRFSEAYKSRILNEVDQSDTYGSIGLILRREGLFSSQLSLWRKQMKSKPEKKKSCPSNDLKNENERLKRENKRLSLKIEQRDKIIELQKKMAEFAESLEKKYSEENPLE